MKKTFLSEFVINDVSYELNMEYLNSLSEFTILKSCEQNPKWHSEGNVMKHTLLSYDSLRNKVLKGDILNELSKRDLLVLHASVLLHDIGKSITTTKGKDGNWHSYGHEIEGEKIARLFLWDEDFYLREDICSLIRYHMEPLRIFESKDWIHKMIEIGYRIPWKLLYIVKMSDIYGSIQMDGGTMVDDIMKMDLIKSTAISLGVWDNINKDALRVLINSNNRKYLPWKVGFDNTKIAYILIGLPGAGKNTLIDNVILNMHENVCQISRDDIRIEFGYCAEGEKYLGTKEEEETVTLKYNELFSDAISRGDVIVLNNVHLKKKYRMDSVELLRINGYKVIYMYVESPNLKTNYERRINHINHDRINAMALSFEWPEATEYDELIISKQTY